MKKRLLLGMMLMGAIAANAQVQIANGANAPELTGQQILSVEYPTGQPAVINYGNTISLQAYLDAGKTVIVDGSATWCAPCWSFHNSKTLENFYNAYGPEGSDELRVIFVEADPGTEVSELGGVDAPVIAPYQERGAPQGNWLTGVPYPVIDTNVLNKSVATGGYGLNAFPTVYVIVPSGVVGQPGKVYNLERDTMANMTAAINAIRAIASIPALVGVDHSGKLYDAPLRSCDATLPVTAYIQSYGHAMNTAQVQLKKNGEVVATQTFTGLSLDAFEVAEITFDGQAADPTAQYQAILVQVDEAAAVTTNPENNLTSEYQIIPDAAVQSSANITIVLHTDEYPSEMGLYIIYYDEAGAIKTAWGKTFPSNAATYKEKTFTYNVDLSAVTGVTTDTCLGVVMQDGYGDGWDGNTAGPAVEHGVTITSGDGTVLFQNNGTFGSEVWQDATFKQNGILGNNTFETSSFAVYPNPSTGIFSFNTEETISVTVTDLTGKTVHTAKGIENGGSINLSGLSTGMYIAKISGASGDRVEKLIIK